MSLRIEYVPTGSLRAYERNARTHPPEQVDQIAASIREFGFANPILVDEHLEIIAGHGRLQAAQVLGLAEVPVVRLEGLTDAQKRALRIGDNQIALTSGWDLDLLAQEIQELDLEGFDLDVLGFDTDFIDDLMSFSVSDGAASPAKDSSKSEAPAEDDVQEPKPDPVSKPGDVWVLGRHRVMCGDSLKIDDVERLMAGAKADLFLTDPPYNVSYVGRTDAALTIENDRMPDEEFRQFLRDAYASADAVMRPGAVFYIWHADSGGYDFRGAARDVGWKIRQYLIWVKNTMEVGRQDYHWRHEPCLYGWKDGAAHYWGSDRKQSTVLEFDRPLRNGEHPTMKPVELFAYLVGNSSRKGDVVLDLFGGSGTTLIACEQLERTARIMELDPRYADVIVRRWQKLTGRSARLESTGEFFDDLERKVGVA